MVSLAQLWLPILLSAVFVFFASSVFNMLLKFWHVPDYRGFSNEEEVSAAIRNANASAGMYMIPYCTSGDMKKPETREKFRRGPVGAIFLRQPGEMNMGASLGQWFVFCLLVSFLCACLASSVLGTAAPFANVFHLVALGAFMAYALGTLPNGIWWGHPWRSVLKYAIDGLIYALIAGATFAWLWPR
ncbi:hypothetical protein ELE36_06265 [Pseudolysobacter antarcticus]|uniref:DUF1761 domain-containing protein n=1 Tax=Pseudolysobacter antarcticus TaxID=2511995 RepID=A0A411HHK7_9GAMM|nr:hypothetical protein [Pseudolysobacter antarcticus]QBB69995.1 hypothetical protein ELE36_06265 [Pseudolysobacter antarcticus]